MKKIFLILTLFFSANSAFADCDIINIGLGKNFSDLKQKYKMNNISVGSNKYYKNIRGSDICSNLNNAEVSLLFLKNKLAQVQIYRKARDSELFNIASSNFGIPDKLPNKDDPELNSYSTFWNNNENAIAYSFNLSKNTYTEKLSIQNKGLSEEFTKYATTDENKENNDNEDKK